ncbi:hypothetical protein WAI453_008054 [Rhynchosporium graminicola]
MASPITFGVELEFNLAYLDADNILEDPTETRQLFFPTTAEATKFVEQIYRDTYGGSIPSHLSESVAKFAYQKSIQYAVRDTLISIGCPVSGYSWNGDGDPSAWDILDDSSISATYGTAYNWFPMEINSPALPFTPASLELILKVCTTITEKYLTDPNESTGLHVHLSAGTTTFDFRTMQKLFVFLWTFETQISSLHAEVRQNNYYCRGLREASHMADEFPRTWGVNPSNLQGIVEFYNCENIESVLRAAECAQRTKFLAFNGNNALEKVRYPASNSKPTVEVRQHAGTLDGERIVSWIKLLAGIIQRLETIHPESFLQLIQLAELEKWEKVEEVSKNSFNQVNLGPIPAESTLTIIDILEYLDLHESADYYRDRLYKIKGKSRRPQLRTFSWNTKAHKSSRSSTASKEVLKAERTGMMKVFQSLMLVGAVCEDEDVGGLNFNPDDRVWSMIRRTDGRRHKLTPLFRPYSE